MVTLDQVLGLLGHVPPGLPLEGEVPQLDLLHDLLSAGVNEALLLTLERHLAGQHGVLEPARDRSHDTRGRKKDEIKKGKERKRMNEERDTGRMLSLMMELIFHHHVHIVLHLCWSTVT